MNICGWFSRSGDVALTLDVLSAEHVVTHFTAFRTRNQIVDPACLRLENALRRALAESKARGGLPYQE